MNKMNFILFHINNSTFFLFPFLNLLLLLLIDIIMNRFLFNHYIYININLFFLLLDRLDYFYHLFRCLWNCLLFLLIILCLIFIILSNLFVIFILFYWILLNYWLCFFNLFLYFKLRICSLIFLQFHCNIISMFS